MSRRAGFSYFVIFAIFVSGSARSPAQQAFAKEIYQDFRGKKPLVDELKLVAPDLDEAIPEDAGLRITLPKTRKAKWPTSVRMTFPLAGDFEITATYEILAIDMAPGGPVGIAFNLMTLNGEQRFAKFGRFQHPQLGSTYLLEQPAHAEPTEAKSGQLRLICEGSKLRYLVADGPTKQFREIHAREYTADDLETVRIGANNNGFPAGIDVRLVDLRIRYGTVVPVQQIVEPDPPKRAFLVMALILGAGVIVLLLMALVVGAWVYLRRRQGAARRR